MSDWRAHISGSRKARKLILWSVKSSWLVEFNCEPYLKPGAQLGAPIELRKLFTFSAKVCFWPFGRRCHLNAVSSLFSFSHYWIKFQQPKTSVDKLRGPRSPDEVLDRHPAAWKPSTSSRASLARSTRTSHPVRMSKPRVRFLCKGWLSLLVKSAWKRPGPNCPRL